MTRKHKEAETEPAAETAVLPRDPEPSTEPGTVDDEKAPDPATAPDSDTLESEHHHDIDRGVTSMSDAELLALANAQPGEMKAPTDEEIQAKQEEIGERYRDAMVSTIARICHEVNRVYCMSLGDNSITSWEAAPDWQRRSIIKGVLFHLVHPEATAATSHESWLAEKEADGWTYGLSKDLTRKTHPCFVAFDSLPKEQQFKDVFFKAVVDACRPRPEPLIAE